MDLFLVGSNILLMMVVQQLVAILVFLQEKDECMSFDSANLKQLERQGRHL